MPAIVFAHLLCSANIDVCICRAAAAPITTEHSILCCTYRLRAHKVWWSSKTPANATLTVATVTTMDRLDQLEAQCSSWAGPLSAVVYVPVVKGQDQASAAAEKVQLADAEKQVMKLVTR